MSAAFPQTLSTKLTKHELVGRAREIAPGLASRVRETETAREPLKIALKALVDAQFFSILTPKMFGGQELHIDAMVDVVRILAAADPSTAWVTAFYIGHAYRCALLPEKGQRLVFANSPFALGSGQAAPVLKVKKVADGYVVSGRASWSSGVMAADWVTFGGLYSHEGAPPEAMTFTMPIKDVKVLDTWYVEGMRGTGSNDVMVEDVFVPEYMTLRTAGCMEGKSPGGQLHANPMYSLPLLPILLAEVAPVMAGIMRGSADAFLSRTVGRMTTNTGVKVSNKQSTQMRAGRGVATADSVDVLLDDYVKNLMSFSTEDKTQIRWRAAMKMRVSTITHMVKLGVNELMAGVSANDFRSESPLQRFFRDINMLSVHSFMDFDIASETYGRALLGLPNEDPLL